MNLYQRKIRNINKQIEKKKSILKVSKHLNQVMQNATKDERNYTTDEKLILDKGYDEIAELEIELDILRLEAQIIDFEFLLMSTRR